MALEPPVTTPTAMRTPVEGAEAVEVADAVTVVTVVEAGWAGEMAEAAEVRAVVEVVVGDWGDLVAMQTCSDSTGTHYCPAWPASWDFR